MSFCPRCGKPITYTQNIQQGAPVTTPAPENHLLKAILSLIFCCLPFSIVSLVYACKVESQWNSGQKDLAVQSARKANNWANASIWSAVGFWIIYIICIVAGVATFAFLDL